MPRLNSDDPVARPHVLPEGYLQARIEELTDANTVGFLLMGSHARGDAARFSDIDLMKFVTEPPKAAGERYVVRFHEENLFAITLATVSEKFDELQRPEKAIWAVPGLRQSRILADDTGAIARLKETAEVFDWTRLQHSAELYAANELVGLSEEAHKLLNALRAGDASAAEYAIISLVLGVTRAVAVNSGLMIPSENDYFRVVRDAVGGPWSLHHEAAFNAPTTDARIGSALRLYMDTAVVLAKVLSESDRLVVERTAERISDILQEDT